MLSQGVTPSGSLGALDAAAKLGLEPLFLGRILVVMGEGL